MPSSTSRQMERCYRTVAFFDRSGLLESQNSLGTSLPSKPGSCDGGLGAAETGRILQRKPFS